MPWHLCTHWSGWSELWATECSTLPLHTVGAFDALSVILSVVKEVLLIFLLQPEIEADLSKFSIIHPALTLAKRIRAGTASLSSAWAWRRICMFWLHADVEQRRCTTADQAAQPERKIWFSQSGYIYVCLTYSIENNLHWQLRGCKKVFQISSDAVEQQLDGSQWRLFSCLQKQKHTMV